MGEKSFEWKYYPITKEKRLAAYLLMDGDVHTGWSVLDTSESCSGKWALLFYKYESGAPKTVEWKQFWNSLEDAQRHVMSLYE